MKRYVLTSALIVFALVLCFRVARAEDYVNSLDRGEFFLAKGSAYMPDAIRALEQTAAADEKRATGDPRFILAISKAYMGSNRLTEAYLWIQRMERARVYDNKVDAIKDHLLRESGVGRMLLKTALPIPEFISSFRVAPEGIKLDANGKKILEKLNQFLAEPKTVGPEGLTLLVPEGLLIFNSSAPLGSEGVVEKTFEMWVGDELEQNLIAPFPPVHGDWKVTQGNRTVTHSWPSAGLGFKYRLVKVVEGRSPQIIYEGTETTATDGAAVPGLAVVYKLYTLSTDGSVKGLSAVTSSALPPVSGLKATASLNQNLEIILQWKMGEGSVDRLQIKKVENGEEKVVLTQKGQEVLREAEVADGPIVPAAAPRQISYVLEASTEGADAPAVDKVTVNIPAEVVRIESVRDRITPNRVDLSWDTYPDDGIAEGYAIYLMRDKTSTGELVGKVKDAFAREYSYVPKAYDPQAHWTHMVLPYVGNRLLVDPQPIEASDKLPDVDFEQRIRRVRKIPNLILTWEPLKDTRRYLVRVGDKKEFIVQDTYVELTGLQSRISGSAYEVKVFAIENNGNMVLLLESRLDYKNYLGAGEQEEKK